MKTVNIKGVILGEGATKIIVPIVAATKSDILSCVPSLLNSKADIIEWRVDCYENALDEKKVLALADKLKSSLQDKPLLVTFRSAKEGGKKDISTEEYRRLILSLIKERKADAIDVELFSGIDDIKHIIETAKEYGVKVFASNHDFHSTPDKQEIKRRLRAMDDAGADVLKIAVMPKSDSDVITLMEAVRELYTENVNPMIAIAMGERGVVSRVISRSFGSAASFACIGETSAPGQLEADLLSYLISLEPDTLLC